MPAEVFTVTISTIRLSPALVGVIPITLWRYIGRKMLRPTIEPQPKLVIIKAQRVTGSRRMESGISGSGGVREDRRRAPGIARAAEAEREHERHARRHDQHSAQNVEPVVALAPRQAA